jgi:murein DD-endopeptidase MepM/ murein hydrolase activator NlpD
MKRNLTEELQRIHTITYGKKVIEEQGFLDKLLKGVGLKKNDGQQDDPKKADLVSDDVKQFFDTLEAASKGDGISQQERGSMTFQKDVETMQIGLSLLGYELPKHGVDGLFGPETAAAVTKFTKEKLDEKSTISESVKLVSQGGGIIGKPGHGTHSASDWQSGNAWDVTGPVGTEVYSLTNGVVEKIKKDSSGGVIKSGVKKIYGDQISIKSSDGKPNVFYTHIDSNLKVGDQVKEGDVIGTIMQAGGIPPHVHVGISSGNLSDLATGMSDAGGSSIGPMVKATPEMLNKLIELLKERGVSSEDLKKFIDNNANINLDGLADANFYKKLLENLGAPVSEENLKFLYAWRQAEGKGGKFNPFNTTWTLPGSTSMNSHGVKNYQSLEDGMVATIKTLRNGRYNCIVDGLKNDIGASNIAKCESLETWGTGDLVAKVVSSYNSGSSPKIKDLA